MWYHLFREIKQVFSRSTLYLCRLTSVQWSVKEEFSYSLPSTRMWTWFFFHFILKLFTLDLFNSILPTGTGVKDVKIKTCRILIRLQMGRIYSSLRKAWPFLHSTIFSLSDNNIIFVQTIRDYRTKYRNIVQ